MWLEKKSTVVKPEDTASAAIVTPHFTQSFTLFGMPGPAAAGARGRMCTRWAMEGCCSRHSSRALDFSHHIPWGSLAKRDFQGDISPSLKWDIFSQIVAKIKWIVSSCKRGWFLFFYSKLVPSKDKRQASGQFSLSAAFHKAMTKGWQAHSQTLKWMNFPSLLL